MHLEQAEVFLKDLRENYPDATFPHNNELRIQEYVPATEAEKWKAEAKRIKYDGPRGHWKCDECDFALMVQAINVAQGTIGVLRVQQVPDCSNCNTPMRPLTWKEACANQDAGYKRLNEVIDEREEQLKKLKAGLKNNNTDFELAFLDAYLDKFKALTRERDDWGRIAEHNKDAFDGSLESWNKAIKDLKDELEVAQGFHKVAVAERNLAHHQLDKRDKEIDRLKQGDFTKEEIHEFCHKLAETVPRQEFEKGCRDYQLKLYGPRKFSASQSIDVILDVMDYAGVSKQGAQHRWRWLLNALRDLREGKEVIAPPRRGWDS